MSSSIPPGYSDDGDACTHGKNTAMYHELETIYTRLSEWYWGHKRRKEFFNDEMENKAVNLVDGMSELLEEIGVPL